MAHSTLHAAAGMAAGLAAGLPAIRAAWAARRPLARPVAAWILPGTVCSVWALVPSLLRFLGTPESVCSSPWMLVFFLHPAIASFHKWTGFVGPALLAALLASQYLVILAAIRRTSGKNSPKRP